MVPSFDTPTRPHRSITKAKVEAGTGDKSMVPRLDAASVPPPGPGLSSSRVLPLLNNRSIASEPFAVRRSG